MVFSFINKVVNIMILMRFVMKSKQIQFVKLVLVFVYQNDLLY